MGDTVATILVTAVFACISVITAVQVVLFRIFSRTASEQKADLNAKHEELKADLNAKHEELKADLNAKHKAMNAKHEDLKADLNAKHEDLKADITELRTGQADIRRRLRHIEVDVAVLKSHALGLDTFFVDQEARTRSAGEPTPEPTAAAPG